MTPEVPKARAAWIAIGSSLGDRRATLQSALAAMQHRWPGLTSLTCSRVYRTRPVGVASHAFFNAVVHLEFGTLLHATEVLEGLLAIERAHGRTRTVRWEDRTLDLDLLLLEEEGGRAITLRSEALTLPHPRLAERDFVLRPWVDLAPHLRLPDGRALTELLAALAPEQRTILGEVPVNPDVRKPLSNGA